MQIPSRNLVPGDVVLLRAGYRVPADLRLQECVNLQVEESALTGESVPVEKHADRSTTPTSPWRPQKHGLRRHDGLLRRGCGIVIATGMGTEFGRIAQMLETVEVGRTHCRKIWTGSAGCWHGWR
jgi:Ca2+-transporting ATPase